MVNVQVTDIGWKKLANDKESALAQCLRRAIPEKTTALTTDQTVYIKLAMFGYIMHVNSFIEFKRNVKLQGLTSGDANLLLHSMLENYEANLGLKQIAFICLDSKETKINYAKILAQNQMHSGNETVLALLPEFNLGSKRKLLARIQDRPLLYPNQIVRNCEKTMAEINTFVTRFVYRKLDFIVKHNNYQYDDLIGDLVRKGVETYYRVTPLVTDLHRTNCVKRSIHNQGMKLISFYTSKKRARIERVSEKEFKTKIDSFSILDEKRQHRTIDANWQVPFLEMEKDSVLRSMDTKCKTTIAIVHKLLCEAEDVQFEAYVRKRLKLNEHHSLEQVYATKPKAYINCIAEYHEIPNLTVRRIAYEFYAAYTGNTSSQ